MSQLPVPTGGFTLTERGGVLLVTTDDIPGRTILRTIGLVRGNTVRTRHAGHDIVAVFKNLVGGEVENYTKMIAESREQALDRMAQEASDRGANAVLAVRFSTSSIMAGAAELLAYGTAVQIADT